MTQEVLPIRRSQQKEQIMLCVYTAALILISILYINTPILPRYPDPFGYLSSGAFFAGYDWSGATSQMTQYYGFGYGTVLTPILAAVNDVYALRAPAVLLNVAFLAGTFLLLTRIGVRLAKDMNRQLLYASCFAICMYAANVFQVNFVIPEVMLVFCVVCGTFLLLKLEESSKIWVALALGALVGFLPALHGRCLGFVGVTVLAVSFMLVYKKISRKQFIAFLLVFAAFFMLYRLMDSAVKAQLYQAGNATLVNTADGYSVNIKNFFTAEGFAGAIKVLLSQLFYLGFSTGLIFLLGLFSGIVYVVRGVVRMVRCKSKSVGPHAVVKCSIVLNTVLLCLLTAIIFQKPARFDHILYGRHNEMILPLVALLGFLYVYDLLRQKRISKTLIVTLITFALCAVMATVLTYSGTVRGGLVPRTVTGAALFVKQFALNPMLLIGAAAVVLAAVALLILLRKKCKASTVFVVCVSLFLTLQIVNGQVAIAQEREDNIGARINQSAVQSAMQQIPAGDAVYLAAGQEDVLKNTYWVRLLDFRRDMKRMTQEEVLKLSETGSGHQSIRALLGQDSALIVGGQDYALEHLIDGFYAVDLFDGLENERMFTWAYGEPLVSRLQEAGFTLTKGTGTRVYTADDLKFTAGAQREGDQIVLSQGGMQFGPYTTVTPGKYVVVVEGANLQSLQPACTYLEGQQSIPVQIVQQTAERIEYTFTVDHVIEGVEFTLANPAPEAATVQRVTLALDS